MGDRAKLLAEAAAAADLRATGAVSPTPIAAPAPAKPAVATAAATGAATGAAITQRRRETLEQREAKAAEQKAAADTWLQEEAQKAQRRKEALEAVGRIRDLQRAGQIGAQNQPAPVGSAGMLFQLMGGAPYYPSMQEMAISPGERPTAGGGTLSSRPDRVVAPTVAPRVVDAERATPAELADQAIGAGRLFTAAISAYDKGKANLEAKIQSGAVAPIDYKKLAEDQQRRLQDVLNLAAQMREYGYVGTNEQLMDKFAPK